MVKKIISPEGLEVVGREGRTVEEFQVGEVKAYRITERDGSQRYKYNVGEVVVHSEYPLTPEKLERIKKRMAERGFPK